jgi:predicted NUDIX family NTP pyrophosphohydrolase
MPRLSAGLLLFRRADERVEVMLVHMGGPFWRNRDAGAWSLPKGEYEPAEDALSAARREFAEELGRDPPAGETLDLGTVKQPGGKLIHAWALEASFDAQEVHSNTFTLEWPRGSGEIREFPEVDRAGWFGLEAAHEKLVAGQRPLLERLAEVLGAGWTAPAA